MSNFPVEIIDGHIIANIGGNKYIIDTGSPSSFGNHGVHIGGTSFSIAKKGMYNLTAKSISALSEITVEGLIGNDILAKFDLLFSTDEIIFYEPGTAPPYPNSIVLPLDSEVMGIPIVNVTIDKNQHKVFFDTGAKLAYLSDELLPETSIGKQEDFHPTIGKYTTNVYKVDTVFGDYEWSMTYGKLPTQLKPLLSLGDTKGILGTEILTKFDVALSRQSLIFTTN
jgi:hypothetical protein